MTTTISPVDGTVNIKHALLIKLTLGPTVYYLSSAYKPITYGGNTYTELGAFLQLSNLTEDIKMTNGDISLSLSGIPSQADYMNQVLTTPIKGGEVTINRAFFNDDYTVDAANVFQRFKGIITNFGIDETVDTLAGKSTNTIGITCASINTILENRISGQRTSCQDREKFYPGDLTFCRVQELNGVAFDFGREYSASSNYGGIFQGGVQIGGFGGLGGFF
tara:strand:+ start:1832 stop:2491 length:660 start_codon:yes stop_codon:yes gene_type:complete